jgi:hypothetical protein
MLGGPPRVEPGAHQDGPGSPGWAGLTRMGRPRPCSTADARMVGHANRPGRPWACGGVPLQRPRTGDAWMFHVNWRQCPGRSASVRSGRQACLSREGIAGVLGIGARRSSPPGFTWNRAGLQSLLPADPDARAGRMFHVEPEAASGGTAPSESRRSDRMSRRGTAAVHYGAGARRHGCPQPIRFEVELRRCSRAGAADSDVWTGWMFHVEPEGQCLVGRRLQIRTPGPDESLRTAQCATAGACRSRRPQPIRFTQNRGDVPRPRRRLGHPRAAGFHVEPCRCSTVGVADRTPAGCRVSRGTAAVLHGRRPSEPYAG